VSLVLVPSCRSFSFARHTHHPSVHLPPHSALLFPSPLRPLYTSMHNANTLSSQGPAPPLAPSSPVPQYENRDAAHEGAPEALVQHYEDYDARFALKHHCTGISPFSAAPLLTPTRATHCGGSGQLFCA
jgi:hypothetical protein